MAQLAIALAMASAVGDVPTGHLAGPLSVVVGALCLLAALAGAALLC